MKTSILYKLDKGRIMFLAYLTALTLLSLVPLGEWTQEMLMNNYTLEIRWDYLAHVVAYMPLAFLSVWGFRAMGRPGLFLPLLLSVLLPVILELAQAFLPYRFLNVNDMLGNGIGVMLGWMLVLIFRNRLVRA